MKYDTGVLVDGIGVVVQSYDETTPPEWLVAIVASDRTLAIAETMRKTGADAFTPKTVIYRRNGNRRNWSRSQVAALPGYVFVRDEPELPDFSSIPGVRNWLVQNGRPAKIPDPEVQRMRDISDEGGFDRSERDVHCPFKPGDIVHVASGGLFHGCEGIVQEVVKNGRWVWVGDGDFQHRTMISSFELTSLPQF